MLFNPSVLPPFRLFDVMRSSANIGIAFDAVAAILALVFSVETSIKRRKMTSDINQLIVHLDIRVGFHERWVDDITRGRTGGNPDPLVLLLQSTIEFRYYQQVLHWYLQQTKDMDRPRYVILLLGLVAMGFLSFVASVVSFAVGTGNLAIWLPVSLVFEAAFTCILGWCYWSIYAAVR
jgi:hypothetical protein